MTINSYIRTALIAIAMGLIAYGFSLVLNEYRRDINAKIIHECAQDYKNEITINEKTKVIRPLEQQVRECAWQKGVRPAWEGVWSK